MTLVCHSHYLSVYYGSIFYCSIFYIIATQFVGTPFTDSLTDEQLELKRKSARTRELILGWSWYGYSLCMYFHPFTM